MKTLLRNTKGDVKFNQLTNKSKRKVYKEIEKRYNDNMISKGMKFNFNRDIPNISASFFENNTHTFMVCYKIELS